jgi:hypothetical protein
MTFQAIHVMQIAGNGFEVMQNKKRLFCAATATEKNIFSLPRHRITLQRCSSGGRENHYNFGSSFGNT